MIEFVTILLGLVVGPRPVEINVVGAVAEVEVRLDGAIVAVLKQEPWRFECDFGPLRSHTLVAVARDASGRELSRAEQWINVAETAAAEASLAFATDEDGKPVAVSLAWESLGQSRPLGIEILFDGRPLEVEDPGYVPLPEYDFDDFHFVSASLHFSDRQSHLLEASFGGGSGGEISSELTAVPVILDRARMPPLRELGSWFLADGEPLAVHGVEKRSPEVVVIRDPAVQPILDQLARFRLTTSSIRTPGDPWASEQWDPAAFFGDAPEIVAINLLRYGRNLRPLLHFAMFTEASTIYFVSPLAAPVLPAGVAPEMFLHSETFTAGDHTLAALALRQPMTFSNQIIEAVAVAGMMAQAGSRRRAVVLLLGDTGPGPGLYPVEQVRRYLEELRVPLQVWAFGSGEVGAEWGEVRRLGDPAQPRRVLANLEAAVDDLIRALKKQRIVWLEGRHLPRSIELSGEAHGIRLAGL
ncbi:MAG: hypothetical protein V3T72_15680 [Thermoanaerobaculia bacterium]